VTLEVRVPGVQSTIQDGGRPGFGHLGVPRGGAVDPRSLAIANLLVGNEPGAAGVELAIGGAELGVVQPLVIGLAGGDLDARVLPIGRRLEPNASYRLAAGDVVHFGGPVRPIAIRAYLAVPGGIDVPSVLGSRSTCLAGRFGGVGGRPLRAGDRLAPVDRERMPEPSLWPKPGRHRSHRRMRRAAAEATTIRLTVAGLPHPAAANVLDALVSTTWTVTPHSDRMGVRLGGQPLPRDAGREIVSHGVTWGTIQVPPDGQPIVLLSDHQPTGGYPVLGVVISADLPALGQLGATAQVHFRVVTLEEAQEALADEREQFAATRAIPAIVGY
jgi:biotin-dependent carboxylase-like uncharacterized protein